MTFSSKYLRVVNCLANMLRALVTKKKEGINPRAELAKKFLRSHPLECRKTPFWKIGQTLHSSKVGPKVIYYRVSYSMNCVFGIISCSHYWKM